MKLKNLLLSTTAAVMLACSLNAAAPLDPVVVKRIQTASHGGAKNIAMDQHQQVQNLLAAPPRVDPALMPFADSDFLELTKAIGTPDCNDYIAFKKAEIVAVVHNFLDALSGGNDAYIALNAAPRANGGATLGVGAPADQTFAQLKVSITAAIMALDFVNINAAALANPAINHNLIIPAVMLESDVRAPGAPAAVIKKRFKQLLTLKTETDMSIGTLVDNWVEEELLDAAGQFFDARNNGRIVAAQAILNNHGLPGALFADNTLASFTDALHAIIEG